MSGTDFEPIDNVSVGIAAGGLAILAAMYFVTQVRKTKVTHPMMKSLQEDIAAGARAFLHTEYIYLTGFCLVVGGSLCAILYRDEDKAGGVWTMLCFFVGALFSASAGYAGMLIATEANARTTTACEQNISEGLKVGFASGAVMSNAVVGLGLVGLSILYLIFETESEQFVFNYLSGFGFGASSIALFARVGGGVFTKAADVGADLVGKVERDIPEDDPRNPATIADNVGDNVGDVAGMGADLFESYVGSIIAAATLAVTPGQIALPFWIAGFGIVASFIGIMVVRAARLDEKTQLDDLLKTINIGIMTAGVIAIGFTIMVAYIIIDQTEANILRQELDASIDGAVWRVVGCVLIGLVAGIVIGQFTEYCTSYETRPTRGIALAAEFGAAPVVIKGLGIGMISVTVPTIALSVTVLACNELAGLYGISLSAVGMLSTLGITLATDAYGPVADNAGGIAEMANIDPLVRGRTDKLDSLGNTTAATGKGFAIGSAVLTSVGLISAFMRESGLDGRAVDLKDPLVLTGLLIGAMLPFVFGALTMLSVDKSARAIIAEVRRQFGECPELLEDGRNPTEKITKNGQTYPDHSTCVSIATTAAIQEMVLPGALAVFVPAAIGFLMGPVGLAGLLAGALTSGFMLALTMANAGGSWDNAKKWVEKCGVEGEPVSAVKRELLAADIEKDVHGEDVTFTTYGRKDAPKGTHLKSLFVDRKAAVVIGDTIGDPFKDTSGPALNILIKLMSIVSLVLAPSFKVLDEPEGFETTGFIIAICLAVGVTIVLVILLWRFHLYNKAISEEAEKKALALRKYLQEQGAKAEGSDAAEDDDDEDEEEEEEEEEEGDADKADATTGAAHV